MPKAIPKGISRIEIPAKKTFGYMVRLRRGDAAVNEFFSDAKHGGRKAAERAAKSHYKEIVGIALPANSSHKSVPTSRNKSGKVGVRKSISLGGETFEKEYVSWTASWTDKLGVRHAVSFAWNKYGKKKAFQLACIARDQEITDREKILVLAA